MVQFGPRVRFLHWGLYPDLMCFSRDGSVCISEPLGLVGPKVRIPESKKSEENRRGCKQNQVMAYLLSFDIMIILHPMIGTN